MESREKVKEFFTRLSEDEGLKTKFEEALKRQDINECALLSKENGFEFTGEDLQYMEDLGKACENGELTEEQMELVSGGMIMIVTLLWMALVVGGLVGGAAAGGAFKPE